MLDICHFRPLTILTRSGKAMISHMQGVNESAHRDAFIDILYYYRLSSGYAPELTISLQKTL
jgi:hypothetical protein